MYLRHARILKRDRATRRERFGQAEARQPAKRFTQSDERDEVLTRAEYPVGRLHMAREVTVIVGRRDVALADHNERVRQSAAEALEFLFN